MNPDPALQADRPSAAADPYETLPLIETEPPEELRFWSVTTILGAAMGKGEGLISWSCRRTAERAYDDAPILGAYWRQGQREQAIKWMMDARWEKLHKAGDRGTTVHGLIEQYAMGGTPEVSDDMLPYDEQVRRFLSEHKPTFEMAEAPVYHPELKYAGTLDSIMRLGARNSRFIVDCKTTDKAPPEIDPTVRSRPPYHETCLQLCAYSRCTHVGVSPAQQRTYYGRRYYIYDPQLAYTAMPKVDGALALVVSPYDYRLVPMRIDDEVWRTFAYARELARWNLEISKRVVGNPIPPPESE